MSSKRAGKLPLARPDTKQPKVAFTDKMLVLHAPELNTTGHHSPASPASPANNIVLRCTVCV